MTPSRHGECGNVFDHKFFLLVVSFLFRNEVWSFFSVHSFGKCLSSAIMSAAVVRSPWLWLIFTKRTIPLRSSTKVDGREVSPGASHRKPYALTMLNAGSITKTKSFGQSLLLRNSLACAFRSSA